MEIANQLQGAGAPAPLVFEDFAFTFPRPEGATADVTVGPVNWSVAAGDFVLLVGATGSGKTTLMRNAKPEIAPTGTRAGRILVNGTPVAELSAQESARSVGYVFQSPENQIVCDTVWHEMAFGLENLGTPPDEMRRRVAEVAHFFGIEPWFRREVNSLSGGQKQMLNLASVLAMQPTVLLLDEPTSQLDPVAEKNFCHALFRLNRELGTTVVVATHTPESFAEYATRGVRLADGKLQEFDLAEFRRERRGGADWPRVDERPASPQDACVSVSDLFVRYKKGDPFVLRGADLQVAAGTIHAVVGGNGSGKSTLLKTLSGLIGYERGSLVNTCRARQAFLPQNPKALFACDNVEDELREWQAACGYSDDAVEHALADCGLAERRDVHPYDISGGQQQMLALHKLLLTDPELLLLDEPTKGLDPGSRIKVAHVLIEFARAGKTAVMATHDLAFVASVADAASMVFDGQVTCTENAASFFNRNLFYRPAPDAFTVRLEASQEGLA